MSRKDSFPTKYCIMSIIIFRRIMKKDSDSILHKEKITNLHRKAGKLAESLFGTALISLQDTRISLC